MAESGPPGALPQPHVQSQPNPPGPGAQRWRPRSRSHHSLWTAAPADRLLTEGRPASRSPRPSQSGQERPLCISGRLSHLPDLRADAQRGRQELSTVVPTQSLFGPRGPGLRNAGQTSPVPLTERPPQLGSPPPRVRQSTAVPAAILNFSIRSRSPFTAQICRYSFPGGIPGVQEPSGILGQCQ
ncbi:hypothetical protein NDU88_005110 [Pleurodeles waltl]|uniref:Uncharacterized protein n=1 Tax=Pleurodeles waltl TaxID=8319 RepID=A0AAV7UK20_PLEWA|nr:hypothetical protein NDU88_005110 [Pleurodeles waltl]